MYPNFLRIHALWKIALLSMPILLGGCGISALPTIPLITQEGIESRTGFTIPTMDNPKGRFDWQNPPGLSLAHPLTSNEAATIALWNNAQFKAGLATLGISHGDLVDAGQLRNPRIDLIFPIGIKPFETILNLPIEVLWERVARVAAAQSSYNQLAQSLIQNGINIVHDARQAHVTLSLAERRESIVEESLKIKQKIAAINGEDRVKGGEITEAEGIKSKLDAAVSSELLIRARHEKVLANERLRLILGAEFLSSPVEVQGTTMRIQALPEPDLLVSQAIELRPDLKASQLAIEAAAHRAKWEDSKIAQFSALFSAKEVGNKGPLSGPGLFGEIPIFHQNNGRRERAEAEVELATLQYLALRQQVAFEVREARELLLQAQDLFDAARKTRLTLAGEAVRIAENDMREHGAAPLFVLEQKRALCDERLSVLDYELNLLRAQNQLFRAMGGSKWNKE